VSKNILLINGSPRGNNSNTIKLANSFVEGLKLGYERWDVQTIVLKDHNIQSCRGCFTCWQKGEGVCAIKDDMPALLDKYVAADLVVWSFPLYHFGMPAIVKAFHERTLPLALPFIDRGADGSCRHPARDERSYDKKHVIISTCGFSSTKNNYEALSKHLDILHRGNYEAIYCVEGELFKQPALSKLTEPYIESVKQAGLEYATQGKISQETCELLSVPMVKPEAFLEMANASWGKTDPRENHSHGHLKAYNFMRQMRASFNPEAQRDINAVLQIDYIDLKESYQLQINNNRCELAVVGSESNVAADSAKTPTTTIETSFSTWMEISEGTTNGAQAMIDGKYRVTGDFNLMMILGDMFGGGRVKTRQQNSLKAKTDARKSKMTLFLLPWIILWIILPSNNLYGALGALLMAGIIAGVGDLKWELTIYERLNPIIMMALLGLTIFRLADSQSLTVLSYLLFAVVWLASAFTKVPFTAWYSRYAYGENALANPLFIKTNLILTVLWGLLYVLTSGWTYLLAFTPLFAYSGLINQAAPLLMGVFTKWFVKWYPARVARGMPDGKLSGELSS